MGSISERRRHQRALPEPGKPVRVQLMGKGYLETADAEDISEGGFSLRVVKKVSRLDLGDALDVLLTLPDGVSFKARATTRHATRGPETTIFGFEFTSIEDNQRKKIADLVARLISLGRMVGPR